MTKQEFLERADKRKFEALNDAEYQMIETLYIMLDLDKDLFAQVANVLGREVFARSKHWEHTVKAQEAYRAQLRYEDDKAQIEEMKEQFRILKDRVDRYEAQHNIKRND